MWKANLLASLQASTPLTILAIALAGIGAFRVYKYAQSLVALLVDLYLLPNFDLKKYGAGKGSWAVVTGASDGIGKEFALQLAQKKLNVVLVSRTKLKLEELAAEIEKNYGVETRVVAMDFVKADPKDFLELRNVVSSVAVSVLVNNVGTNHEIPVPFADESDVTFKNIVEVNINGTMKVTKAVLPHMIKNKNGLILNIGSFAGLVPTGYLSVYSGSKAFLSSWSQAIATELEPMGIMVRNVNTYFVVSAMSKIRRPTPLIPTAKEYVKKVLTGANRPGGARDGAPFTTTPYPTHALIQWVMDNFVSKPFLVMQNAAMQRSIRTRALRKMEREAAAAKKA